MGLRGAPTTPTALKELRGNPGRRPLPENEPSTDPLSITPSTAIENDEIAKEFWYAVGNMTKAMNVAQESDRMALEILAMSLAKCGGRTCNLRREDARSFTRTESSKSPRTSQSCTK